MSAPVSSIKGPVNTPLSQDKQIEVPSLQTLAIKALADTSFFRKSEIEFIPQLLNVEVHKAVKKEIADTWSLIGGLEEIYRDTSNLGACDQALINHANFSSLAIHWNSQKIENLMIFDQKQDDDLLKTLPSKLSADYTDQELVDLPQIEIKRLILHTNTQDQLERIYAFSDLTLFDDEKTLGFTPEFRDLLLIKLRTLTEELSNERVRILSTQVRLYRELSERDHLMIDLKRRGSRLYNNIAHLKLLNKMGYTIENDELQDTLFSTPFLFAEKYANQAFQHYTAEDLENLPVFLWGKVYEVLKEKNAQAHDLHTRYSELAHTFKSLNLPHQIVFCETRQTAIQEEVKQLTLKIGLVESIYRDPTI